MITSLPLVGVSSRQGKAGKRGAERRTSHNRITNPGTSQLEQGSEVWVGVDRAERERRTCAGEGAVLFPVVSLGPKASLRIWQEFNKYLFEK